MIILLPIFFTLLLGVVALVAWFFWDFKKSRDLVALTLKEEPTSRLIDYTELQRQLKRGTQATSSGDLTFEQRTT